MSNRILALLPGRVTQICVAGILLAALADWPYGYYQFLRWAVCAGAVHCAWRASQDRRAWWVIGFVGLALLFNPFKIIHFRRDEWAWIDVLAALVFLAFPLPAKKRETA